jgi:SseB protein N-terminal domain
MRTIPDPGFAGDDGSAPERLAAALSVYQQDPDGGYLPALAALCGVRLLVPVLAVLGEVSYDAKGLAHDKSSDMAAVLLQRPDGRQALLAFTSTGSLTGWNADGRPVPVPAATAALAAIQDGAEALLVDVAGPVRFVVEGEDLAALARGWRLVRLAEGWGWETDVH